MANFYLKEIKSIQPKGPYLLGGYSFGANVAFEIARILEDQGDVVDILFVIDGWSTFSSELKNKDSFIHSMENTISDFKIFIPDFIENKKILLDLLWSRMELLLSYRASKINTKIMLFKAMNLLKEYQTIDDDFNHWSNHSSKPIDVYPIDTNHKMILNKNTQSKLAI